MTTINLLNQTANGKSVDENSANLINLYLVADSDQGKYDKNATYTPGLTLFSAGVTEIRCEFSEHGVTYGVDGSNFYSVDSSGTRTSLGTLNTSTGWAKIRGISNQLFIADGTNGYTYTINTGIFATILTASSGGIVQFIDITNSGTGYDNTATCSFSDSTGSGATGIPIVAGGVITGVTITNGGSNYTAPTITFSAGTGVQALALVQISTNSFPALIQDIECQDEFGLVLQQSSQVWFSSAVSNLSSWPQLSFASTTGNQNNAIGIVSVHRELFILGTQTTEIWDNAGTNNFTWGRNTSAFIEYGCAAVSSIAKADNAFFFLAQSISGGTTVMRMEGYNPKLISNSAINYQISTYTVVSDAIGFTYQQEGHEFYVLTFPTAGITWVYDISTGQWHQRQSLISGNQTKWIPTSHTFNYNLHLVGDPSTGNIYFLDMANYTDNGSAITRTMISHPFYAAGAWLYLDNVQIDFDTTPTTDLANWSLFISRNGGNVFGSAKIAVPQVDSNGMYRVYWNRLGQAHAYGIKIQTSANMKCIILGASALVRGAERS